MIISVLSNHRFRKWYFIVTCLCWASGCSQPEEEQLNRVVTVKVVRAQIASVNLTVNAPATLFPRELANVAARTASPIRELRVHKGDTVKAGEILAVLDNSDLQAQEKEAEAAVMDAQANLERISSGTLMADLERARGQVAIAEATLNQAQKNYTRRSELFAEGAIPQRELLASQTELAQAKTALEVAKKVQELLEQKTGGKEIRQAESHLAQAKAHLQLVEAQLQFTVLRSPFAGTITDQFLYPGDMAKPDVSVFTVMDLSSVIARAQVPEEETWALHVGQEGIFTPTGPTPSHFTGHVTVVNKAVDTARRSVEVWCEIPNRSGELRAGIFGTLSILTGTAPHSVVVPLAAVQFKGGTKEGWVMVVDSKQTAHKVDVKAGEIFEGKVQITQGLHGNELLIVEGAYGLPEGTKVKLMEKP